MIRVEVRNRRSRERVDSANFKAADIAGERFLHGRGSVGSPRRHGDQLRVVALGTLHACPRLGHGSFWLNSRSVGKGDVDGLGTVGAWHLEGHETRNSVPE